MAVIEVAQLTKSFRTFQKEPGFKGAVRGLLRRKYETKFAVKDVSFSVDAAAFVGLLGPTGPGTTTTLTQLDGRAHPPHGTAHVLQLTTWESAADQRPQFALLLGQKNQLWWDLPARDSLELNARIYDLPQARFERTVDELSELLGVKDKLATAVRELSLGERMKCELIAALLHEPRVLFLDEPTIGLDVVSAKVVRDFLRRHNRERRTTLLLTSHYMADIQELCERVIIIDKGCVFFDGKLEAVLDRFADFKVVTINLDPTQPCPECEFAGWGEVIEKSPVTLKLKVKRDRMIPVVKELLDRLPVKDFSVEEVPIEEIIRRVFQSAG